MKALGKRQNLLITAGLGGAAIAYVMLLFLPTQRSIAALQDEMAQHHSYIAQQQNSSATLTSVDHELRVTREFSHRWSHTAPQADRLAPVIGQLADCAQRANVTTVQFDPQPVQPMSLLAKAPVTMVCEGEFASVFDLLRQIELLPQTIWVEGLQMTRPETASDSVRCELTLLVFADKREDSH